MNFPFFRSQRANPSVSNVYGPTIRGIPVRPEERNTAATAAARTPKVVQIPVHFVGSEPSADPSMSASKIQKVFRGFLVRRSVKKIMAIKKEVDEIEARVLQSEEVELIKKDAKERLKVNEMLMALLLKLDSVRGVDSGVRECRKAVIKKAIALQERVDAIASSFSGIDRIENESEAEMKGDDSEEDEVHNFEAVIGFQDIESGRGPEERTNEGEIDGVDKEPLTGEKCLEDVTNSEESGAAQNCDRENVGGDSEMDDEGENADEDAQGNADEEACDEKGMLENVDIKNTATDVEVESLMEEKDHTALGECVEDDDGIAGEEVNDAIEMMGGEGRKDGGDDNSRNRELLEKMMEENEKMMKLMSQLYERNEVQMRMLNTLTHRVEQLEKAFVCDKIKRKKKRHSP